MSTILIGTSGYYYQGWMQKHPFFKPFYTSGDALAQYVQHFDFVEINNSFYKTPTEKAVLGWKDKTPKNFSFLVKVNKYITGAKKLIDFDSQFPPFYDVMVKLGEKLQGFLIQLPPNFTYGKVRSKADGLTLLERVVQCARFTKEHYPDVDFFVEFRHPSWFCDEVYDALRDLWSVVVVNTHCLAKMNRGFSPPLDHFPNALTVPGKIMFRNHGTSVRKPYSGGYSDEELVMMMSLFQKKTVVCFDNTDTCRVQPLGDARSPPPGTLPTLDLLFRGGTLVPDAVADAKRLKEIV